jgi:hypothetical protein
VTASDETIYIYAVDASSTHSVVLANLKDSTQELGVSFQGWKPARASVYEITAAGFSGPKVVEWREIRQRGITMSGKSVTILVAE